MDAKDKTKGEEEQKKTRVRLTLTCKNLESVEKVSREMIGRAKGIEGVKVHGPVRMPTKILRIGTRKSPCGNGTNTYDKWEMRIFKRVIDFVCSTQELKEITSIKINPGVEVELNMTEDSA